MSEYKIEINFGKLTVTSREMNLATVLVIKSRVGNREIIEAGRRTAEFIVQVMLEEGNQVIDRYGQRIEHPDAVTAMIQEAFQA